MQLMQPYEVQKNHMDYGNPEFLLQLSQHHVHPDRDLQIQCVFPAAFLIPLRLVPDHSAKLQHLIQHRLIHYNMAEYPSSRRPSSHEPEDLLLPDFLQSYISLPDLHYLL